MLFNPINKRTYLTLSLVIRIAKRSMWSRLFKTVHEKAGECVGKACNELTQRMSTTGETPHTTTPKNTPAQQTHDVKSDAKIPVRLPTNNFKTQFFPFYEVLYEGL